MGARRDAGQRIRRFNPATDQRNHGTAVPIAVRLVFRPRSGPNASVSGYYSHRSDLRTWQRRMRDRGWSLAADGLYGPRTRSVALAFQREKHLAIDGLIGPETWRAAWTSPIT
ncbi:peptidoglycan-binding domain-containing protein [Nocardiopsis gilva]|uniref:peptidoglycan-binding domain-containing protein n=1 Tax=Nocardiopsis gilva TaxID=280236 RepID=UPI001E29F8DA|nr:peptidoglycan-binding domain-containing protein [Nocardiopsis gilva]